MRYIGLALATSAVVLAACGGGDSTPADTATPAVPPTAMVSSDSVPTVPMMPITGTTHEVKMIADAQGYRFEPKDITIKSGDGIHFVTVSGQPHNVGFAPAELPMPVRAQLKANMQNQQSELVSMPILNVGDDYTISFGGVAPGTYKLLCPLHIALGMTGTVTVQ